MERKETKQQSERERHRHHHARDHGIERHGWRRWQQQGQITVEDPQRRDCEHEAGNGRGAGQQKTFHEQLPQQRGAPRSERDADRELGPLRIEPREEKIPDVHPAYQQHEQRAALQQPERIFLGNDVARPQRRDGDAETGIGHEHAHRRRGGVFLECVFQRSKLIPRRRGRGAGRKPPVEREIATVACLRIEFRRGRHIGQKECGRRIEAFDAARCNAHDRVNLKPAVEVYGASFGSQSSGLSGLFQHK